MGSAEEGVKQFFSQIFNRIPWNPVKVRLKSLETEVQGVPRQGWKSKIRLNPSDPICVRPHLPSAEITTPEHYGIVNYYAGVFLLRPPYLLRCEPLSEGQNACKTQENCVSTGGVVIVNHCVIVNLLRILNLLRRSIFSTAGSFGICLRSETQEPVCRPF